MSYVFKKDIKEDLTLENVEQLIEIEKTINDMEYELITEFTRLRKCADLTQQDIADQANVIRTTIARIENHVNSPQVKTLLQMLAPLGYTLKIEKIEKID